MNRAAIEARKVGQYLRSLPHWLWIGVKRDPFVWEAQYEGGHDYTEPWTWKMWMIVRPRYWGLVKKLPCGCSRRLGRVVLYRHGCHTSHGRLNPTRFS